jgi:hypothetical protein
MTDIKQELEKIKKGLVCLVPRKGLGGITCHEKTVCDCQVLKIISCLEIALVALEKCSEAGTWHAPCISCSSKIIEYGNYAARKARQKITGILTQAEKVLAE